MAITHDVVVMNWIRHNMFLWCVYIIEVYLILSLTHDHELRQIRFS